MACAAHGRQAEIIAGIDEALQPDFIRRDLALMQQHMKLDAAQHAIIESLFCDYEAAFREAADETRRQAMQLRTALNGVDRDLERHREHVRRRVAEIFDEARRAREESSEADAEQLQQESRARAEELRDELKQFDVQPLEEDDALRMIDQAVNGLDRWKATKARLRATFVSNALATINDEQRAAWPALEQTVDRARMLPRGKLSGESVDLHHIVAELNLPDDQRQRLAPTLEQYATRLNDTLRRREMFADQTRRTLLHAIRCHDESRAELLMSQHMNLRVAVRNVNDDFAAALAALLEPDVGQRLQRIYRERAYSRVFRPTRVQRKFNAALETPDLDAELIGSIRFLQTDHTALIQAANERLLQAVRSHEPAELVAQALNRAGFETAEDGQQGNNSGRSILAIQHARDALDLQYETQLQLLLPPPSHGS